MSKLSSSKRKLEFKYVSERHTITNLCTAQYAFKSCTLAKLWVEMLFRFQWQMVKWLLKLRLGLGLVSISPLKSSFREKKEIKNVKTNILTNTPLIFLNFENRNILIVLNAKIPRHNDKKKYWYSCPNATREWYYTRSNIDII